MNSQIKASVIISVYKNVDALNLILNSLENQTYKNFEVLVSEDGESNEMNSFFKVSNWSFDLKHLTQIDEGWQKNKALNNAIRMAKGDWLIFIDGDCVLHPRFIEFHMKLSNPNHIVGGKRIKLDEETSKEILDGNLDFKYFNIKIIKRFFKIKNNGGRYIEEGFFINPNGFLGFIPKLRPVKALLGSNMSFHKDAIKKNNGFDEDYTKPATGEDADLLWRFLGLGYKLVSVRNLAVQYHLYHKENWNNQEDNLKLMKSKMSKNMYICNNGLIKK